MIGKVLGYDIAANSGVISGEDGKRYKFVLTEWKGANSPGVGNKVNFSINGENAEQLYVESAVANITGSSSKKIPAAVLAFFLGVFGAHKFYLGYNSQGIIMLLVFIFGFILIGIPSMIIGIIAFIEFILYLTKSDDEFEAIYVTGRKPWF